MSLIGVMSGPFIVMIDILQINCNCSRVLQDLVIQYMYEHRIQICTISEPHRAQGAGTWAVSADESCAIVLLPGAIYHKWNCIKRGTGFVMVEIDNYLVISCYFSPSLRLREFLFYLSELEVELQKYTAREVVLMGDFNARSIMWGDRINTSRGNRVYDMISGLNLRICNQVGVPTCVRVQGNSVIDLAFVSNKINNRYVEWSVCDTKVYSDDVMIRLSISKNTRRIHAPTIPFGRCWSTKNMDNDRFLAVLIAYDWCNGSLNYDSVDCDQAVELFNDRVAKICDVVLPRHRGFIRRGCYWWNARKELRCAANRKRRKWNRVKRRNVAHDTAIAVLFRIYWSA